MPIDDHLLSDLRQAQRSLDELPNAKPISGTDHVIDVATVSAILGQTIQLLELDMKGERLDEANTLLRRMRTRLSLGDYTGAEQELVRVKEIIASVQEHTF